MKHALGWTLLALSSAIAASRRANSPAPTTHHITILSESFRPDSLVAQLGDTVVWQNSDIVRHTVTSKSGDWDSGRIAAGARFVWISKQKGEFAYYCTTHKGMKGVLVVR